MCIEQRARAVSELNSAGWPASYESDSRGGLRASIGDPEVGRGLHRLTTSRQPHAHGALHEGSGVAGCDHRLGRDAIPEVGSATDCVSLNEHDLCAQSGRCGGTTIARGTPTDNYHASRHQAQMLPAHGSIVSGQRGV